MVVETNGKIIIRIASSNIEYNLEDNIEIEGAILDEEGLGLQEIEITSPAGYLYYDEINGVHTFYMGEEPVLEEIPNLNAGDYHG